MCVDIEELPSPVDGGWGNWSDWGACSRTCGAGVSFQSRECDHPTPVHGGSFCIGERARYKICNIEPCPENEPSFRAKQCSKKDGKSAKGQKWLPFLDVHDPCKLYCTDKDDTVIQSFDTAEDGTPCKIGSNSKDMCIAGICKVKRELNLRLPGLSNCFSLTYRKSAVIGLLIRTQLRTFAAFVADLEIAAQQFRRSSSRT